MSFRFVGQVVLFALGALLLLHPVTTLAQDTTGISMLRSEVGSANVNGSGVIVGQGEASNGMNYVPDVSLSDFDGKTFWDGTGASNGTSTNHSTNIAKVFYGLNSGFARGVDDITNYDADDWINNVVNYASGGDPRPSENNDPSGSNPDPMTLEVINHSWIAQEDPMVPDAVWTDILERVDFMVNRDNCTICAGTDNSGTTSPLLAPAYNAIIVGKTTGQATGPTTFYGAGRYKPEIVAPKGTTSAATALTSGCAAILKQNSRGTNAEQNEVIKALLLAGATKEEFPDWDRTTTRPYDEVFGCGEVNIYNSYYILQGGEFDGADSRPETPSGFFGWDYSPSVNNEKFYAFNADQGIEKASFLLTWNVDINDLNGSPSVFFPQAVLANMDLELYDSSGNIVDSSVSTEYNIEHIYVENLPADVYTLRVVSNSDHDYGFAWRIHGLELFAPTEFTTSGVILRGDLTDLVDSDNQKIVPATGSESLVFDVKSVVPGGSFSQLTFTLESSVRSALPVTQEVFLFDYDLDDYVLFDTRDAQTLGDDVVVAEPTGGLTRFVQPGTHCVEARIVFTKQGLARGVQAFIDQAVWHVKR